MIVLSILELFFRQQRELAYDKMVRKPANQVVLLFTR
jgi:hypothetical protein